MEIPDNIKDINKNFVVIASIVRSFNAIKQPVYTIESSIKSILELKKYEKEIPESLMSELLDFYRALNKAYETLSTKPIFIEIAKLK